MSLNIFRGLIPTGSSSQLLAEDLKLHNLRLAVIDIETTGVLKNRDRVIEIAILCSNGAGEIEDEFVTLINPNRDLGKTSLHGICASDIVDAPDFKAVAGDISQRLKGRIIVGHNIQFDLGIISAEFERLGYQITQPSSLCTLRLAYTFGPQSRKLSDCCLHFGINQEMAHSAYHDAKATLALLQRYLSLAMERKISGLQQLEGFSNGDSKPGWPELQITNRSVRRSSNDRSAHSFLSTLISDLPEAGSADIAAYLDVLDRALEDRKLSKEEISELTQMALETQLSQSALLTAHQEYVLNLIRMAQSDHVITENEMNDIKNVARLLGFDSEFVKTELEKPQKEINSDGLKKENNLLGKRVCFTGSMTCTYKGEPISRELAEQLAIANGLIPVTGVSKKTDVLVIADPDSMSSKAKKAREYGTRIVADRVFWQMLGVSID